MRNVLERAAVAACATAVLSASSWAQTPATDPAQGARAATAASAAEASAPATVQTPSTRPRTPAARATDPSNPVDPAAADPGRPADPTRAPETSPRGDARGIDPLLVHVAARDALASDEILDAQPLAPDAPSHALAACMRERDRAVRARCAHDAAVVDAFDTSEAARRRTIP